MTTRELALHLIEHAETAPDMIDLDRAAEILRLLDPASELPADLSPESFRDAWNDITREGAYTDNWS